MEIKNKVAKQVAEWINDGTITTKQKLAYENNWSRSKVDNMVRKGEIREIKIYKNLSLIVK